MNNGTKSLILLTVIFGAGCGTGYGIANALLKKKYAQLAQDEIDSVKERFVCEKKETPIRYPQDIEGVDIEEMPEEEEEDPDHDESKDYKDDPLSGMTPEEIEDARAHHRRVVTDYASMYKAKPSLEELSTRRGLRAMQQSIDEAADQEDEYEDAETDEERELREGAALGRVNHDYPYIIEPEQYETECDHYDKLDIYYYAKDDTICDEQDTPMDDTEDYDAAIAKLQMQTSVYIRNERIGADYAIHRLNRSYKEDILGIAETPTEREYRHMARRKSIMDGE